MKQRYGCRAAPMAGVSALVLGAALLVSCAGGSRAPQADTASADPAAIDRLRRTAQSQIQRPVAAAMKAPLPPGVPPEQLTPIPDDPADPARLPLASVLDLLAAQASAAEDTEFSEITVSEPQAQEAMRLYIAGRMRLLSGDVQGASAEFVASLRLDPRPGEAWRELGEAQLAAGNRNGAMLSLQRAVARNASDVRSLELLGRFAIERRDYTIAAVQLGRLRSQPLAGLDPALPYIVDAQLGRALGGLGYVNASVEALRSAVDLPERFTQTTSRPEALSAVYRQRGDLWRDIGDGLARLGLFDEALRAYDQAAQLPTLNPASLTPRRVYAALKSGRPALAQQLLLEQIIAARGRVDDSVLDLIPYAVGGTRDRAAPVAEALAAVPEILTPRERALAASDLSRARAAALPGDEGIAVLRAHLARTPTDEAALSDLLARRQDDGTQKMVEEVVRLIEAAPLNEPRYTSTLSRTGVAPDDVVAAVAALPPELSATAGAALLQARALLQTGRAGDAERVLATAAELHGTNPGITVARVRTLAAQGRFAEADAVLATLPDAPGDGALQYAKALALAERGDFDSAIDRLAAMLDAPDGAMPVGAPPRAEVAVLAGTLNVRAQRFEAAERRFKQAIEADPGADEAYAGLLFLYAGTGPLANEDKLLDAARLLREARPSSPTLRWIRAREAIARSQFDLAERELLDLDQEYPSRAEVVETLVAMWLRSGSRAHAESWLRTRAAAVTEGHAEYLHQLADVLVVNGKAEEAAELLEDRIAKYPGDLGAARRLENVLRDKLGRGAEADEMALARLATAPRTLENLLERAAVLARLGRVEQAIAAADEAFAATGDVPESKLAQVSGFVLNLAQESQRRGNLPAAPQVVSRIVERVPGVNAQAHAARIILLSRAEPIDADEIIRAADLAAARHPEFGVAAYVLAIDQLVTARTSSSQMELAPADRFRERVARATPALRIAEHAAARTDPLDERLIAAWIIAATSADNGASLATCVRRAREQNRLEPALDLLAGGEQARAQARNRARADWLYAIAASLSDSGQDEQADELYELCLEIQPQHPTANNARGYRLLEQGRRIDEAARMIEIAFDQMPDEAAIIDSMGWARYKQGLIHDERGPDGVVTRRGAINLLEQCVELAKAEGDPTILAVVIDHLADALWAGGHRERAIALWDDAASKAAAMLKSFEALSKSDPIAARLELLSPMAERELRSLVPAASAKARAAREDGEPAIAPIFGPINSPHRPHEPAEITTPPSPMPAPIEVAPTP